MNTFSRRPHGRIGKSHGFATVEAAIVLPVFLMLMLASAELGRAFYQYNTLTKSVRNGARFMAAHALYGSTGKINPTDDPDWTSKTTATQNLVVCGKASCDANEALLEGLTEDDVTVTPVDTTHVNVTASYAYQPLFAASIPTFGYGSLTAPVTLTASLTMRGL